MAVKQQQDDAAQVDALLGGGQDDAAQVDALLAGPEPKQSTTGQRAGGVLLDRLLNLPPGQYAAAQRTAEASARGKNRAGPRDPRTTVEALSRAHPNVGTKPTVADMDRVATEDEAFAAQWAKLKETQEISRALAEGQDFEKNRAALLKEALGKVPKLDEMQDVEGAAPLTREQQYRMSVYSAGQEKIDRPKKAEAETKAAEIPGIHRPPISDEELAQAGFALLREELGKQQETLPGAGKAVLRGIGSGVKLGATALIPTGALGVAARGMVQGAALSGVEQAQGLASGAQDEFSPFRLVTEALTFGAASKVGEAAALAMPGAAKTAATVGTLGTFEAAGAAGKLIRGESLAESGGSLLERGIETAVAIGTGGVIGAGSHGRPSPARIRDAEMRAAEGPSNYASSELALEGIRQKVWAALEKVGFHRESPVVGKIKARVEDEMLPNDVEITRSSREYNQWLDRMAEGDAQKRAVLADSLMRTLETDGQMPVPRVVAPEQFAEGMRLIRAYGKSALPLGSLMQDHGAMPEGRYQHKSTSAPDEVARLSTMTDLQLLDEFKARSAKDPASDLSDITNEMSRRTVKAENPQEYAENLQAIASKKAFGPKTPYGNTTLEDAVNQAVERALPFAGSSGRQFGKPMEPAKPESLTITKKEFDQGHLDIRHPDGTVTRGMDVSRADAAAGKYGDLIGGYKYHAQRGFYFPQITPESAEAVPGTNLPIAQKKVMKAPFSNPTAKAHLKARNATFAEAIEPSNKVNKPRVLDTSPGAALKVFQEQSGALRDKMVLDFARDEGLVLKTEQLPDIDVRSAAAADAIALKAKIGEMEKAYWQLEPVERLVLRQEINAAHRQLAELNGVATGQLYKQAVGKQWGDLDGMWIHRDILRQARMSRDARGDFSTATREIDGFIKKNLVGLNIGQWLPDFLGNIQTMAAGGVNSLSHIRHAWRVMWGSLRGKTKARDALDDEFFIQAKGANLGGPLDIGARDLRDTKFIEATIARNKDEGRNVAWLLVAKAFAQGGVGWFKPFKALEPIAKGRRAFIDEAQSLAAYRALRERGVDDAGPMSQTEAFSYLQGLMDYNTLPRPIQAAGVAATFIRFSSKVIQGLATRALVRRPGLFGVPISTPLDSIIKAAPGSNAAQAALVGRGVMRLVTQGVQWIGPILAAQQAALLTLGSNKEQLDRYLDAKYDYLPPHTRWLLKQTTIPYWKTKDGFHVVEVGKMFPSLVALRYFWLGGGDGGASWVWNAVQKNVLAGTAAQIAARKDFKHENVEPGIGPNQQWWPLVEILTPALATRAIDAYAQETHLPPEERHALSALARSMLGAPLALLRNPDFRRAAIDRYIEAGVIGKREDTQGGTQLYVIAPETPDGIYAAKLLKSVQDIAIDEARAKMKMNKQVERKRKRFGIED